MFHFFFFEKLFRKFSFRLRKSQENLALASNVQSSSTVPPSSTVSRSKSIGSLTHAQKVEGSSATPRSNGGGSLASTLRQARQLTKSVGNLHGGDVDGDGARPTSRPLTETLKDFRKLSSSDLRIRDDDDGQYTTQTYLSDASDHGSFYAAASTTLPRYQKAKGVVQKKAAAQVVRTSRFNQTTVDRASASGDSEDSSDASAHPKVTVARSASGLISKRVDHYSSPRRAPSSVESSRNPQIITSTPIRPQDAVQSSNRRNSSYLAKILSDEGADEKMQKFGADSVYGAKRNGGLSLVASEGSESGDGHYESRSF